MAGVGALLIAVAALASGAQGPGSPSLSPTPSPATLVRELLDSLGPRADAARHAFDAPERRRWRRDPSPRPGIALAELTGEQQARVAVLLATVLSPRGLAAVEGIRAEQDLLARDEEGLGSGLYWLACYGEPGAERWAWRLGGHHVSLHATYAGESLVSLTPLLLGGEVQGDSAEAWAGYQALRAREELARELARSGSEVEWKRMGTSERTFGALALSEPAMQPLVLADEGIALADLSPPLAARLRALIAEHLAPLALAPGPADLDAVARQVTFAWAGSRDLGAPHSYRIRAPGLLIEYVNSGRHIHSLLRSDLDFGGQ